MTHIAYQPESTADAPRPASPRALKGWRTVKELAEELRFTVTAPSDPEKACREWLAANGIVGVRRGRVILVDGLDVDKALRGRG